MEKIYIVRKNESNYEVKDFGYTDWAVTKSRINACIICSFYRYKYPYNDFYVVDINLDDWYANRIRRDAKRVKELEKKKQESRD